MLRIDLNTCRRRALRCSCALSALLAAPALPGIVRMSAPMQYAKLASPGHNTAAALIATLEHCWHAQTLRCSAAASLNGSRAAAPAAGAPPVAGAASVPAVPPAVLAPLGRVPDCCSNGKMSSSSPVKDMLLAVRWCLACVRSTRPTTLWLGPCPAVNDALLGATPWVWESKKAGSPEG